MKLKFKTAIAALLLVASAAVGVVSRADEMPKETQSYAYWRGSEALDKEDYATAESWFDQELQSNPKNGYAYFSKGVISWRCDKPGMALTYFDKALKLIPKKEKQWMGVIHSCRARVYLQIADTVSAYDAYAKAIKFSPDDKDYCRCRGDLYYEQGRFDEADADYQRMLRIDPNDSYALTALGRSAMLRGYTDDAILQLEKVIRLYPGHGTPYRLRGEIMAGQGRWNEAADDYIKAVGCGDNYTALKIKELPEEGMAVLNAKLKIMMTKDSQNVLWPYLAGSVYYELKNYPEAIEHFKKVDAIYSDASTVAQIGTCYLENGDYAEAVNYYTKALNMNPSDVTNLCLRGDALEGLGRLADALDDRDRAVEAYPDNEYPYITRAFTNMKLGNYAKAIEDFEIIAVLDGEISKSTLYLIYFGDAYRLSGKMEKAREYYNKVVAIGLMEKTPNTELPLAYASLGESDKAVAAMERVFGEGTDDAADNRYQEACMFVRLGRKADAMASLRMAIKAGYKNGAHIMTDFDMAPIRETPEFKALMRECFPGITVKRVKDEEKGSDEPEENTIRGVVNQEVAEVPFTREQGVARVKCAINDLPLYFVFDTGASDVTISQVEATFMLKNDYIKPSDVIGSSYYVDANGDVSEGTVINLKKVNFGGLELDNVRASVVRNQKAPLLLGQSVLGRLGKIEIDNPRQKIIISSCSY